MTGLRQYQIGKISGIFVLNLPEIIQILKQKKNKGGNNRQHNDRQLQYDIFLYGFSQSHHFACPSVLILFSSVL